MAELRQNLKLTVEYDGTAYFGWQSQDEGHPTVQKELERAIEELYLERIAVQGSGRTDRGVHALGQVCSLRAPPRIPVERLPLAINSRLPGDIRVLRAEEVPDDFHARYSALGKRYRYTILRSRVDRVFLRRTCAVVRGELDVPAMREAAAALSGVHDFRAFEGNCKRREPAPGEPPRSTVRTVAGVLVRENGPFVILDAFGRGFLYGMVRAIAGTLIEVGARRRPAGDVAETLRSLDRRRAGFAAPPEGLCLMEVYYREGELERCLEACRREAGTGPGAVDHKMF